MDSADIVSAESVIIQKSLQPFCKNEILYIPNGYTKQMERTYGNIKKEKIILTVGRFGTYPKATEVLLNAYAESRVYDRWKLVLVGSIEEEFRAYIERFFSVHPELKEHILFEGLIKDRELLKQKYGMASIFILSSRYEGFPLVLLEAMLAGCYIIATEAVLPVLDIMQNINIGKVVPIDAVPSLAQAIRCACHALRDPAEQNERVTQIRDYAERMFRWEKILIPLDREIKKKRNQLQ